MALCPIAVAFGIVGIVAVVKRLAWRRRFYGPMAFAGPCGFGRGWGGGGPFAFGGPFGGGPFDGGSFDADGFDGPWGGGYGGHHGPGHRRGHRFGGPWGWRGGHFGGERSRRHVERFMLRMLFGRLETSVAQEREIRAAVEDFQRVAREAKDMLGSTRESASRAVSGEVFDEIAMGEATVKFDTTTAQVKEAFEAALRRVHGVLDAKQRAVFAELLETGFGRFAGRDDERSGRGGPYRDSAV